MDDEAAGPWGFLVSGALVSALAWFMLAHSQTSGEDFFGFAALWFGGVLTVAGAVRLGLPAHTHRPGPRVSGPGGRRIPW